MTSRPAGWRGSISLWLTAQTHGRDTICSRKRDVPDTKVKCHKEFCFESQHICNDLMTWPSVTSCRYCRCDDCVYSAGITGDVVMTVYILQVSPVTRWWLCIFRRYYRWRGDGRRRWPGDAVRFLAAVAWRWSTRGCAKGCNKQSAWAGEEWWVSGNTLNRITDDYSRSYIILWLKITKCKLMEEINIVTSEASSNTPCRCISF